MEFLHKKECDIVKTIPFLAFVHYRGIIIFLRMFVFFFRPLKCLTILLLKMINTFFKNNTCILQ